MASLGQTNPHEALAFKVWNFCLNFENVEDISTAYRAPGTWHIAAVFGAGRVQGEEERHLASPHLDRHQVSRQS